MYQVGIYCQVALLSTVGTLEPDLTVAIYVLLRILTN